jgi:hypothetical protein
MALAPCRECGQQISTEADSCPHCGVPSPTQSDEWIELERRLDTIAPGGGRLALRIKQNLEAGRGRVRTFKDIRDQDRSLELRAAKKMYEVVEAHLRYSTRGESVERPAQPSRDRPAKDRTLLVAAAFGAALLVFLIIVFMMPRPTVQREVSLVQTEQESSKWRTRDSSRAAALLSRAVEISTSQKFTLNRTLRRHNLDIAPEDFVLSFGNMVLDSVEALLRGGRSQGSAVQAADLLVNDLPMGMTDQQAQRRDRLAAEAQSRIGRGEGKPASARPAQTRPETVDRRAVYSELVRVQDRGYCEGKRLYPGDLQRQADHMDKTSREAYQTVARKYGITEQAAKQIAVEGTKANWPMPDSPCD